ncbi:YusW-like protein [Sinobaca qinghaiensis]|uniref:YusW-like protein n=1 Tax=Sinobaca qinghaiensis TaxID=342944 RepID=A0A419V038_9BACL|nr:YusW family protein [Sinobaca qinghaiensis]RKD71305.1 YusW-like protein [Sinobaca qinghaiensis]
MKKAIVGLSAVFLLAACGDDVVDMEEESSGSGEQSVQEESTEADNQADEEGSTTEQEESAEQVDSAAETQGQASNVQEFDLHLEFLNDEEWEYEYERNNSQGMEVDRDGEEAILGADAEAEIEGLLGEINITTDRPLLDMKQEVLEVLNVSEDELEDMDLEIEYDGGETIEFDHETAGGGEPGAARQLNMDIELTNSGSWEYDYEADEPEAEIEQGDGREIEGQEAVSEAEALLDSISITMDYSIDEMKQEVLGELGLTEEDVQDFDIDVEYESGESVKFKHDKE